MNQARTRNVEIKARNQEGANTFVISPAKELYSAASAFKYKNGSYLTNDDHLALIENSISQNIKNGDLKFVFALTWFLGSVNGLRLSPTVMLSYLIHKKLIKVESYLDDVKFIVDDVFTRPDFIANSLAYYKKITNAKTIGSIDGTFKTILRNKLSTYSPITLKKRKMKSRDIKLADLIKVLKPYPKTQELSKLYKDIIENNNAASLSVVVNDKNEIVKADSAVAVLTNDSITQRDKVKFLVQNIDKIAINELIRNLTVFPESAYDNIEKRLISALSSPDAFRFTNPFDLLLVNSKQLTMGGTIKLQNMLDRVLSQTVLTSFNFEVNNPVFLIDISGSMGFQCGPNSELPMTYAIKYMAFLLAIILKTDSNYKIYNFDIGLYDITDSIKTAVRKGKLQSTPNSIATYLCAYYMNKLNNGTSLRDCTYHAIQSNPSCDAFFVFSDEVSWADARTVDNYTSVIPSTLHNKSFVFNVMPTKNTVYSKTDKVTRISGFDGKVLYMMNILLDFDSFKESLVTMYNHKKMEYVNK